MRFFVFFLLIICSTLLFETASADFISPAAEKVDSYYVKLGKLAKEKKILELQKALSEVNAILQREPNNAIKCLCWSSVLACISPIFSRSEFLQTEIDKYLDEVVKLDIESLDSKLKQISLLRTLLRPEFLPPSDENMKSKRAKRVARLIDLTMEMYVLHEPDWNPDDTKNIPVSESNFYNVISSDPTFIPDPITEPEESEKYERFCRQVAEYWQKRHDQVEILSMFPKFFNIINQTIIDSYSVEPRNDDALIRLLEKSNYPFPEQIKILCALKIPYKGFREWQSTDKLFKTNAKFISLENGDVTLEKSDGKRTTIEFSVLRKEDQDYVKEQLNPETKTPKNETTKD